MHKKKFVIVLLAIIFILQACQTSQPIASKSSTSASMTTTESSTTTQTTSATESPLPTDNSEPTSSTSSLPEEPNPEHLWRLVIHGVDVTERCRILVDLENHYQEFPLLAIMKELGATSIQWIDETHARFYFSESEIYLLDTERLSWIDEVSNIRNGSLFVYGGSILREKRGDEFYVNEDSLYRFLREEFNLRLHHVQEDRVVHIHGFDNCDLEGVT